MRPSMNQWKDYKEALGYNKLILFGDIGYLLYIAKHILISIFYKSSELLNGVIRKCLMFVNYV
jgi:hypothetical protein